jgi:hypothetical protein
MCFFKKKQKKLLEKYASKKAELEKDSKFKIGEFVHFRYRDELYFGYVEWIYTVGDSKIYDIQVGGQCPAVIKGVKEENIFILKDQKRD